MILSLSPKRRQWGYSVTSQTPGTSPSRPNCWESLSPGKMPFRIHFSTSFSFLQILKISSNSKAKKNTPHDKKPAYQRVSRRKREYSSVRCQQSQQDMGLSQTPLILHCPLLFMVHHVSDSLFMASQSFC